MTRRAGFSLALLLAIAGSVLFHLGALFVPDLDLGAEADEPPPLEARLTMPAPAAVTAPPPAKSKPHPAKMAAPAAAVPQASTQPAIVPVTADAAGGSPAATPGPVAPAPAAAPAVALPGNGGILYNVTLGPGGPRVGRAVHRWEFERGRYRIYVMTETAGVVAFFRKERMEYESRGAIIDAGLQPEAFSAVRNGAEPGDTASFDWSQGLVTISRTGKSFSLTSGAQDFASFYYQLVILGQAGDGLEMGVATVRSFQRYRFDVVGEEDVETEAGTFRTQHLRVQTDMTLDLWLALDRQRLPVKIRYTDRKGQALEQVAVAFSEKSPI